MHARWSHFIVFLCFLVVATPFGLSATPTETDTDTSTPTLTESDTSTPSVTKTDTSTATPSRTPSYTRSPTPTITTTVNTSWTITVSPTQTPTVTVTMTPGVGSYSLSPGGFTAGSSGNNFKLTYVSDSFWTGGFLSIFVPNTLGTPSSSNFFPDSVDSEYFAPTPVIFFNPGPNGVTISVQMANLDPGPPNNSVSFFYAIDPPGFAVSTTISPQSLLVSANPADTNPSDPGGYLLVQPTIGIYTPRATKTITPTYTMTTTATPPWSPTPTKTATKSSTITPTYTITPLGPQRGGLYCYPNPYNMDQYDKVTFRFPNDSTAKVTVFNLSAGPVREIPASDIHGAQGWAIWNGVDDYNRKVTGGLYYVRIRGTTTLIRKFTVIR